MSKYVANSFENYLQIVLITLSAIMVIIVLIFIYLSTRENSKIDDTTTQDTIKDPIVDTSIIPKIFRKITPRGLVCYSPHLDIAILIEYNDGESIVSTNLKDHLKDYIPLNRIAKIIGTEKNNYAYSNKNICWNDTTKEFIYLTNNSVHKSFDGLTWTRITITTPFSPECGINNLVHDAVTNRYVFLYNKGYSQLGIMTSLDGKSWTFNGRNEQLDKYIYNSTYCKELNTIWYFTDDILIAQNFIGPFVTISSKVLKPSGSLLMGSHVYRNGGLKLAVVDDENTLHIAKISSRPPNANYNFIKTNIPTTKKINFIQYCEKSDLLYIFTDDTLITYDSLKFLSYPLKEIYISCKDIGVDRLLVTSDMGVLYYI